MNASSNHFNVARAGVASVQLVFGAEDEPYNKYRRLLGTRVQATGDLFGAMTGHHHTDVLLHVTTLATGGRPTK